MFGKKPDNSIFVPNFPFNVRNNCQSARWMIEDEEYGSKLSLSVLKFSKFYGDLGMTFNQIWGQIWFIAESGELPKDIVCCTYIKTKSLRDFNRCVASVQCSEKQPEHGIFTPEFVKNSGQTIDENGDPKKTTYYSLKWSWTADRSSSKWTIEQLEQCATDPANQARMIDVQGTANMICVDNLPPHELATIMMQRQSAEYSALPPAEIPM